jgi:hypothetical protein
LELHATHGDNIDACSGQDKTDLKAYLALSEMDRADIRKFGLFRCVSHRVNLMGEHSFKDTERDVLCSIAQEEDNISGGGSH